jgi:urease accessory protein
MMPMPRSRSITTFTAAITLVATFPASARAHHAMGGGTPGTFLEGLLSGLAHPVLEPAHLAAVLLSGAMAARLDRPTWIVCFVVGSFVGTASLALELPLSPSEALVSISPLLLAGLLVLRSSAGRLADALVLLTVGVVHGLAFAETIVGAESTPLAAYLLGLAIAELALAGLAAVGTLGLVNALNARRGPTPQAG